MFNDMFSAAEIVHERQARIVQALSQANIRFALSGSNATYVWIANTDAAAVREYRNVEFIIRDTDIELVKSVLTAEGLIAETGLNQVLFRSTVNQKDRWSDRAYFAGELFPNTLCKVPSLESIVVIQKKPIVDLLQLVRSQLCRWSLDDRVDLRDMIDVGLLDRTWLNRLTNELGQRLVELLDNPDG